MARCSAAWPLAVAIAPMPPSNAAMRSSSTALVGLLMRLYTWPARSMLNSEAACSLLSNTNEVLRWMGTARAPVAGSGAAPACRARVSNPGSLWPAMSVGAWPLPSQQRPRGGRRSEASVGFSFQALRTVASRHCVLCWPHTKGAPGGWHAPGRSKSQEFPGVARGHSEHGETRHEGERHPARQGRHAVHGVTRRTAGRCGQDHGRLRHRLAGGDGPRRAGGHADVPRSDLGDRRPTTAVSATPRCAR